MITVSKKTSVSIFAKTFLSEILTHLILFARSYTSRTRWSCIRRLRWYLCIYSWCISSLNNFTFWCRLSDKWFNIQIEFGFLSIWWFLLNYILLMTCFTILCSVWSLFLLRVPLPLMIISTIELAWTEHLLLRRFEVRVVCEIWWKLWALQIV